MSNLLKPAVNLMNQLNYPKKMGVIGGVGALVIAFLFYVIFQQLNKTIIDSKLQLQGIERLVSVNKTIQLAQQYRGYSAFTWSSNTTTLAEKFSKVEKETETSLLSLLALLPPEMPLKTGNTDVSQLHKTFLDIKTEHGVYSIENNFAVHTHLITQLQLLLKLLSEHYLLITDSELTSYYLIDNLVNNIPEVTEAMGQVRAIVTGALKKKKLSSIQKDQLIRLESMIEQSFGNFEFNLSRMKRHSPELSKTIDEASEIFIKNKNNRLNVVKTDILTEKFNLNPEQFLVDITAEIDVIYNLMYQNLAPLLRKHIENRINGKQIILTSAAWLAGILILFIIFLMAGLYKAVIGNINHISKTINAYSQGNSDIRIELDTHDEMREISIAINTMADTVNKSRNEIAQEKLRFQVLFEKSGSGLVIIENGVFVDCNEKALAMMGFNKKSDLLKSPGKLSPEYQADGRLSSEKSQEMIAQCIQNGSHDFEWIHKKKDGTNFWVHVLLTRLDYQGIQQIHVVWRDINSQVEMKNRLEEKSKQLVFQQSALDEHAIVSMTDKEGNITYVNDKFKNISQYSSNELIGQNHRILRANNYYPDVFYSNIWTTITSGKVWHGEIKNQAKDGSVYWVSSTIVPQLGNDGKPEQYIAIRTEITKVKELERIAKQEKKNADDANQEKSNFLANMSHELRTPMHGILSFADLGISNIDSASKEDLLKYFSIIQVSGKRLLVLLNDLLDLSKLEAGKMELHLKKADLMTVFEHCQLEQAQRMKNLGLSLEINTPTKATIGSFDSVRIGQVITNILSNAIQFSPKNSVLTITVDKDDDNHLLFSLKDTGVGIPEDELNDVFDSFIQSSKTKTGVGGTGLGLAISKEIIEMHGGKIWAENNVDGGAIFTFTLP